LYGVFIQEEGKSERAIFVIDKQGFIRYIDIHDIDEQPDNEEVRKVLREIDPEAALKESKQKDEKVAAPELPKEGIVLYCTPWCPGCRQAKRWLQEQELEYTEVDITKVYGAAEQVMKWANGNRTTPTFDIDGKTIVDWDEAKLRRVLKEKGYL